VTANIAERFAELPRMAPWDAIASCHNSLGTVRARRGASLDPALQWKLHADDFPILRRALWILSEIFFAAGAQMGGPDVTSVSETAPDETVKGNGHPFGSLKITPHRHG